ncbi:MAG: hypothetical protein E7459_09980, partial [Ruminococcaceae bacterium]|nr:hypothetical protein [Oscillospiraceae bacterium]
MKRKVLSMILALVMIITCLVSPAMASQTELTPSESLTVEPAGETVIRTENGETVEDEAIEADTTEVEILVSVNHGETVFTQTSDLELAVAAMDDQRAELYAAEYSMESVLGFDVEVDEYFSLVFNGFSFMGEAWMVDAINEVEGLSAIVAPQFQLIEPEAEIGDVDLTPDMGTATGMVGATDAWELGYTGKGMVIGIIDTGIKQTHEAFSVAPEGAKIDQAYLDKVFEQYGTLMHGQNTEGVYYSAKMPYNWDYFDSDCTPNHTKSAHGSHVAGIAAGNNGADFKGIAPDAQIVTLQVFTDKGSAYTTDLISALEDAVYLGVDAVNMSLGITAGFEHYDWLGFGPVYEALEKAGIAVVTSAGNDGHAYYWTSYGDFLRNTFRWLSKNPDNGMIGTPGNLAGSFTVGNSVNMERTLSTTLSTGGAVYTPVDCANVPSFSELAAGEYELVYVGTCAPEEIEAAGGAEGKILLSKQGGVAYEDKCANAAAAGAAGLLIYKLLSGAPSFDISSSAIPCGGLTKADGQAMIASMTDGVHGKVTVKHDFPYQNVTMHMSSSWGTTPNLKLKPDIAAPGTNINSAEGRKLYKDNKYTKMTGTSMSAPAVAGGVLVVKQYLKTLFPDATGQELYEKAYALIMSTAGHAGVFVRQQGAGIMNLEKATTATAYLTDAQGKRPKLELGENETGTFQLSFRVNNIGKTDKTYNIDFKAITEKTSQFNYQGFNQMGKTPEFAKKTNRYPWLHQDEVITVLTGTVWDVTDQCTMDGEKTVTVKAGETATVTLTLKANDSLMEHFRTNCPAGMYLEGWVNLTDTSAKNPVDLSIPYLGYVGDWDKPAMIDEGWWWQNPYGINNLAQFFASGGVGGIYLGHDALEQGLGVNLYADGKGETYLADRNAISPNGDGYLDSLNDFEFSLLRQPKNVKIYITDADGKVLKTIADSTYGYTRDYGGTSQAEPVGYCNVTFEYLGEDLEENETAYFVVEAYLDHEGFTLEGNDFATITVPFYKDLTAPVVTAVDGGVEIQDTNYVAYYAVYTDARHTDLVYEDGVFAMERGAKETYLTDMDKYFVAVADFAHNEAFYYVENGKVYELDAEGFDHGRTLIGESQWNMTRYDGASLEFTHCMEHAWYALSDNLQQAAIALTEVDYEANPYDLGLKGAADIDWVVKSADNTVYASSGSHLYKFDPVTCTVDRESGIRYWMEGVTKYIYLSGLAVAPGTNDLYGVMQVSGMNVTVVTVNWETGELIKLWDTISGGLSNGKKLGSTSYTAYTMKDADTLLAWGSLYGTFGGYYLFAEINVKTGEVEKEIPMYGWQDGYENKMGNMRSGDFDRLGSKWMLLYDETENCAYLSGCWGAFGYMHKDKGGIAKYDFDNDSCKWYLPGDGEGLVIHGLYFLDEMVDIPEQEHICYIKETVAPTCTTEGYTLKVCAECGEEIKENVVAALGHDYETVVTEPTCTELGYTTYTCKVCGDTYKDDYKPATDHKYGQWQTVKEATCTEKGQEKRTCECGAEEFRDVDVKGHDYKKTVTEPTCTTMGYTTYTCSVCGDTY